MSTHDRHRCSGLREDRRNPSEDRDSRLRHLMESKDRNRGVGRRHNTPAYSAGESGPFTMAERLRPIALQLALALWLHLPPVPASTAELTELRSFPLVHISATEAERIVRDLVGRPRPNRADGGIHAARGPRILVNRRSNSLLVLARRDEMRLVAEIIKTIDVPEVRAAGDVSPDEPRGGVIRLPSLSRLVSD